MFPALKNNAAAGYQGPVKIELLKGACLLLFWSGQVRVDLTYRLGCRIRDIRQWKIALKLNLSYNEVIIVSAGVVGESKLQPQNNFNSTIFIRYQRGPRG